MDNRQRSNKSKPNSRYSSSNNDLEERRAHTNAIFDELLRSSRSTSDNVGGRVKIDEREQIRARAIADERLRRLADARLAMIEIE